MEGMAMIHTVPWAHNEEDGRGTTCRSGYICTTERGFGRYVHCSRQPISGSRMNLVGARIVQNPPSILSIGSWSLAPSQTTGTVSGRGLPTPTFSTLTLLLNLTERAGTPHHEIVFIESFEQIKYPFTVPPAQRRSLVS